MGTGLIASWGGGTLGGWQAFGVLPWGWLMGWVGLWLGLLGLYGELTPIILGWGTFTLPMGLLLGGHCVLI